MFTCCVIMPFLANFSEAEFKFPPNIIPSKHKDTIKLIQMGQEKISFKDSSHNCVGSDFISLMNTKRDNFTYGMPLMIIWLLVFFP